MNVFNSFVNNVSVFQSPITLEYYCEPVEPDSNTNSLKK